MFDKNNLGSQFLRTTGLFVGLFVVVTGILIYLIIEEVEGNFETSLLQKAELRAYKIESTIEEVVLLSGSASLSELSHNSSALFANLEAIFVGDSSYLYCIVQDNDKGIVFQDVHDVMPRAIYESPSGDVQNMTDLVVQKLELKMDGIEKGVYHFSVPIVIQDQVVGVMKLGLSEQDIS